MLPINERFAALNRVTDATSEAITVDEAKAHSRISISDDDAYLQTLILRARHYAEDVTGRSLLPETWRLTLQNWPGRDFTNSSACSNIDAYYRNTYIELPRAAPLISIESFKYFDTAHAQYSLSNPVDFIVSSEREPARVVLPYGQVWPTRVLDTADPIQLTYQAGYAEAAAIPPPIIQAMLMLIAHWYENREAMVVGRSAQIATEIRWAPDELLWPYRIGVIG